MKTQILNFINWFGSIFEEDHGKASMKRWLALFAFLLLGGINVYTRTHLLDANSISFTESLTDALLMFIALLLGLSYIPTRKQNDNKTDNP